MLNFHKEHRCGTFSSDKSLLFSENNEKRKKDKKENNAKYKNKTGETGVY